MQYLVSVNVPVKLDMLLSNPKLAKEMGKESYKICKNLFSIEQLRKIYADLFVRWEFEINDSFRCTSH